MGKQEKERLCAPAQEAIRIRVVHYLRDGKGTQAEAATVFMLSLSAVKQIWKRYRQQGLPGILAHPRGPQNPVSRLTDKQAQSVCHQLCHTIPDEQDLPYPLWTAAAVRELIKKRPASPTTNGM